MSDVYCTPGREPRSVAASRPLFWLLNIVICLAWGWHLWQYCVTHCCVQLSAVVAKKQTMAHIERDMARWIKVNSWFRAVSDFCVFLFGPLVLWHCWASGLLKCSCTNLQWHVRPWFWDPASPVVTFTPFAEGLYNMLCHLKSCQLLHNCMKSCIWKACIRCIVLKITQGHWKCHCSIGDISLPISDLHYQHLALFPRYYHFCSVCNCL